VDGLTMPAGFARIETFRTIVPLGVVDFGSAWVHAW
jgi:hypothetical protein